MCDVPNTAVFCSESIECFPGTASKFFFKLLVNIPVAPIITGTTVHFRFHIHCTSIQKLRYLNFFSASVCTTFLPAGIVTNISVNVSLYVFKHYYYYYYLGWLCDHCSWCASGAAVGGQALHVWIKMIRSQGSHLLYGAA